MSFTKNLPFTYLIGWSKYDVWYYGRRTAAKCKPSDLWKTYFTSSKQVKKFTRLFGDPDIVDVRRVFDDIESCKKWELKVLQRLDAANNIKFLNLRNGDGGLVHPKHVLLEI